MAAESMVVSGSTKATKSFATVSQSTERVSETKIVKRSGSMVPVQRVKSCIFWTVKASIALASSVRLSV